MAQKILTLVCCVVLLGGLEPAHALDKSWQTTGAPTRDWNDPANWNGGVPGIGDNAWITNTTTATTITNRSNGAIGTSQVANFVMSNKLAGATQIVLTLSNQIFAVDGTSLLGSNAVVNV